MDDTSPSETVCIMGNIAVGDTALIHGAFPLKVGRSWGERLKCGEMLRNWGEGRIFPTPVLRICACLKGHKRIIEEDPDETISLHLDNSQKSHINID
jgi:hypothetical protein